MPVERVSRGFKDISMSFEVNPINNDIIGVKNDTAIARSIRNLVFTVPVSYTHLTLPTKRIV